LLTAFPGSNSKVLFHQLRGFAEIGPDVEHLAIRGLLSLSLIQQQKASTKTTK
jgi:hypothetical protein